jgi:hypothetical protein
LLFLGKGRQNIKELIHGRALGDNVTDPSLLVLMGLQGRCRAEIPECFHAADQVATTFIHGRGYGAGFAADTGLENLMARFAHHLSTGSPRNLLGGPVKGGQPPLGVNGKDAVADVVEDNGAIKERLHAAKDLNAAHHIVAGIKKGGGAYGGADALTIGMGDKKGAVFNGPLGADTFRQNARAGAAIGFEDVAAGLAQGVLFRPAGVQLGRLVERGDFLVLVHRENAVDNTVQDEFGSGFFALIGRISLGQNLQGDGPIKLVSKADAAAGFWIAFILRETAASVSIWMPAAWMSVVMAGKVRLL